MNNILTLLKEKNIEHLTQLDNQLKDNETSIINEIEKNNQMTEYFNIFVQHIKKENFIFLSKLPDINASIFNEKVLFNFKNQKLLGDFFIHLIESLNNETDKEKLFFFSKFLLSNQIRDFIKKNKNTSNDAYLAIANSLNHINNLENDKSDLVKILINELYQQNIFSYHFFKINNLNQILSVEDFLATSNYFENYRVVFKNNYSEQFIKTILSLPNESVEKTLNKLNISPQDIKKELLIPFFITNLTSKTSQLFQVFELYSQLLNKNEQLFSFNVLKEPTMRTMKKELKILDNLFSIDSKKYDINIVYSYLKRINFSINISEFICKINNKIDENTKNHINSIKNIIFYNQNDGEFLSQLFLSKINIINYNNNQEFDQNEVNNINTHSYLDINLLPTSDYHDLLKSLSYNIHNSYSNNNQKKLLSFTIEFGGLFENNIIRNEEKNLNWIKKNKFNPISLLCYHDNPNLLLNFSKNYSNLVFNNNLQFNLDNNKKNSIFHLLYKTISSSSHFDEIICSFVKEQSNNIFNIYEDNKNPLIYDILTIISGQERNNSKIIETLKNSNFELLDSDLDFIKNEFLPNFKNDKIIYSFIEEQLIIKNIKQTKKINNETTYKKEKKRL